MNKTVTNTLVFLRRSDEILLAMKKVRFGAGKWNGVGGKVEKGETIEEAALRELKEEIGVVGKKRNLKKWAIIHFYGSQVGHIEMHVFDLWQWEGEPQESEEMQPQWFTLAALPYESMWADDPHWLPHYLQGEVFKAEFWFDDSNEVVRHILTPQSRKALV